MGTGIGLPIAKYAVKALGGDISAESKLGQGSTFHVGIPVNNKVKRHLALNDPQVIAENMEEEEVQAQNADIDSGKDYTVLVVEDNRSVAHYIGQLLKEKYNIVYAENGQEGLDKAVAIVPDVIVSDVMMPVMNGQEMCRRLRSDDTVAHVPIVMVTAKITDEDRLCGLEAGADAYITKPFNSSELLIMVDKLLEQRRRIAAGIRPERNTYDNVRGEANREFIASVTDAVNSLISNNKSTDVPAVSSVVCMSPSQFYRKMGEVIGLTPAAFIRRVKVRKACVLLDANPEILLTEVAIQCGFNEYSSFVRAFRNVCGISPKQYVKSDLSKPV